MKKRVATVLVLLSIPLAALALDPLWSIKAQYLAAQRGLIGPGKADWYIDTDGKFKTERWPNPPTIKDVEAVPDAAVLAWQADYASLSAPISPDDQTNNTAQARKMFIVAQGIVTNATLTPAQTVANWAAVQKILKELARQAEKQ